MICTTSFGEYEMPILPINHIASDPTHRSGQPRVVGTGITVQFLAGYLKRGYPVEEVCRWHDLTAGQVYAAWSYYADHQVEIDAAIAEDEAHYETIGRSLKELPGYEERLARMEAEQSPVKEGSSD